jgi:hypothetical protein
VKEETTVIVKNGVVMEEEHEEIIFEKYIRKGPCSNCREEFCAGVAESAKKYRKSYRKLQSRERDWQVVELSKEIMAACVDRDSLCQDGEEYIHKDFLSTPGALPYPYG